MEHEAESVSETESTPLSSSSSLSLNATKTPVFNASSELLASSHTKGDSCCNAAQPLAPSQTRSATREPNGNESTSSTPSRRSASPVHEAHRDPSAELDQVAPSAKNINFCSSCARWEKLFAVEVEKRKASEEKVASLTGKIELLRQLERDDAQYTRLERIQPTAVLNEKVRDLEEEVSHLKHLLTTAEKELKIKEERVSVLQEKIVDQLLATPKAKRTVSRTTPLSRSSALEGTPVRRGYSPSLDRSGRTSVGSRGLSPTPRKPDFLTSRASPLISLKTTNRPLASPLTNRLTRPSVESRKPLVSSLGGSRPGTPRDSIRSTIETQSSATQEIRNTTPLQRSKKNSSIARTTPQRTRPRPSSGTTGSATPLKSRIASTGGHPALLNRSNPTPLSTFTNSRNTLGSRNSTLKDNESFTTSPFAKRAFSSRASTSPSRSMAKSSMDSRGRSGISYGAGRHDTTVVKGTTTTVTFRPKTPLSTTSLFTHC